MSTHPEPDLIYFEAVADGLSVDRLLGGSVSTEPLENYAKLKRLEMVVDAHRRILEQSPNSIDLDLAAIAAEMAPQPAPPTLEQESRRWGHMQILESVGRGGFGEIFRAHDSVLEREVALKLMHPRSTALEESKRRFLAEARILARIRHDNVVVVHGAAIHDGRMGIWTDFVRGSTLEQLLTETGPFSAREAALVGVDLCRALAALHTESLVHRDVKTSNVMREEGGRIILLDFGLVTNAPDKEGGSSASTGGTPLFMAPEVLRRDPATVAADIYSLGVLLYRLVSGEYPVKGRTTGDLRRAHEQRLHVPLRTAAPGAPSEFVRIVEKATSLDPADRYSGAGAMELALIEFINPTPVRLPLWKRPETKVAAAAVVALTVLLPLMIARVFAPDFDVRAAVFCDRGGDPEQILSGGRVYAGDLLHMRLRVNQSARVYVLNESSEGATQRIFPLDAEQEGYRLSKGRDHSIPVEAGNYRWEISSSGGRESLLLVVLGEDNEKISKALDSLPSLTHVDVRGSGRDGLLESTIPGGGGKTITIRGVPTTGASGVLGDLMRLAESERGKGARVYVERFDLRVSGVTE